MLMFINDICYDESLDSGEDSNVYVVWLLRHKMKVWQKFPLLGTTVIYIQTSPKHSWNWKGISYCALPIYHRFIYQV